MPHPDEERNWMVDLTVEFGSSKKGEEAPYSGKVSARGWFVIAKGFPEERHSDLIEVTAASILYGTCREALANFTARSVHGILSIPSVTFDPIPKEQKSVQEAPVKRVAKKANKSQQA